MYSHDTTAAHRPLKARIQTAETAPQIDIIITGKPAFGADITIPFPKSLGAPRLEKTPNKPMQTAIKNSI